MPEISDFGSLPSGTEISLFGLSNHNGMRLKLINYGATLTSLQVPDSDGQLIELTLGFDTLQAYLQHPFFFGCTIGRVANRIARGEFQYQNKIYKLARNENDFCHLHGGAKGFDKRVWDAACFQREDAVGVEFSYLSRDGEENYPGNLAVKTTYVLTAANELKIIFEAATDQPTPVNLTNHTYWNLAGAGNILDHEMEIFSDYYLATDNRHLPTGEIKAVANSAFDFRQPKKIRARIQEIGGYDHCYALENPGQHLRPAARVKDPVSNRILQVHTTQPGVQFYSGNYLADYALANGKRTERWGGFCLETQGFPDAVNQANFPSIILLPGETYRHETVYKVNNIL